MAQEKQQQIILKSKDLYDNEVNGNIIQNDNDSDNNKSNLGKLQPPVIYQEGNPIIPDKNKDESEYENIQKQEKLLDTEKNEQNCKQL